MSSGVRPCPEAVSRVSGRGRRMRRAGNARRGWSAGRRSTPIARGARAFARRAAGPIARVRERGLANPWRLPALHPPFRRNGKRGQGPPRAFNNRGDDARPYPLIRFEIVFTVSASTVRLKKNDTALCAAAIRRIDLRVIGTSDTCDVMPMTSEKYRKSQ